jgi:hypothetical protein
MLFGASDCRLDRDWLGIAGREGRRCDPGLWPDAEFAVKLSPAVDGRGDLCNIPKAVVLRLAAKSWTRRRLPMV